MDFFSDLQQVAAMELIVRAVLFIFAFFGLGILLGAGQHSIMFQHEPQWKRTILKWCTYACYFLCLVNVGMIITWFVLFFV